MKRKYESYIANLIHYLNDWKKESELTENVLKGNIDYLKDRLSKDSATDTSCILALNNLLDKYSYLSKYIKVSLDFYKELDYAKS